MAVVFDAATSAEESSGDGVVSFSHVATGSNLGAFGGVGARHSGGDPITSTSFTLDAAGMTEQWDLAVGDSRVGASYTKTVSAGTLSAVSTVSATTGWHAAGVMTATGVDSTTPVGTPATSTTGESVTVGSVGADDLVVDSIMIVVDPLSLTVGANQTEPASYRQDDAANDIQTGSYQDGADGGVMSWSGSVVVRGLGAIAFKPTSAAADQEPALVGGKLTRHGLLLRHMVH